VKRPRLHWGTAIAAVYALFAASTAGFVVFAMSRPVQLVSADYYERSLTVDARLAAIARADALGPRLRVVADTGGGVLALALPPEQAAAARGRVTFYRPSDEHADRTVPLALDRDGRQQIPLAGLATGRWLVRVEWTAASLAYYREQALTR
jgi:nitrogen fixation protein FixH